MAGVVLLWVSQAILSVIGWTEARLLSRAGSCDFLQLLCWHAGPAAGRLSNGKADAASFYLPEPG